MQQTPSDHFDVTAVMLKQASSHPWGDDVWSLLGLFPGLTDEQINQAEQQGEVVSWLGFRLKLYPLHCHAYYHNLLSSKPMVYLVCSQGIEKLEPILLTIDYDEAASYMETGEQVFNAALPDELCVWLERFVLAHYTPEAPKKRKRQKWHKQEMSDGH